MNLLIVDDDIPTVEVIKDSIRWNLFNIHSIQTAFNVESAKESIIELTPDIIICDIEMPKGSGIDLIKWIRENNYTSQFIFLTCHENFEFATTAITYEAAAYVTKPFNIAKTEAAIAKAINNVLKSTHLKEYSTYGEYWIESKSFMEGSFWVDLLFNVIPGQMEVIKSEMLNRHLLFDIPKSYYLILTCVGKSQLVDSPWDENTFKYALRNLTSEVILGGVDFNHDFCYLKNESFCNVILLDGAIKLEEAKFKCQNLINICQEYLHCSMTCYISEQATMENLANTREALEQIDKNNIISKSKVILQKDYLKQISKENYSLNFNSFDELLNESKAFEVVNTLRKYLEMLANKNHLDSTIMHSIQQDFLQVIYSNLYDHGIQAHKLFEDKSSQKLLQYSENSIFDMMKWAAYITNRTIDFTKEIKQSGNVIEKIKEFIHENYKHDIGREEISSHVFLTQDYISKLFKAETGLYITDYINEFRINKAKELLLRRDSSISSVATETGFNNFSYFSILFKKITGKSPSTFKKDNS